MQEDFKFINVSRYHWQWSVIFLFEHEMIHFKENGDIKLSLIFLKALKALMNLVLNKQLILHHVLQLRAYL